MLFFLVPLSKRDRRNGGESRGERGEELSPRACSVQRHDSSEFPGLLWIFGKPFPHTISLLVNQT